MKNLKNVSTFSVPSGTGGDGCPWHRLKWASAEIWQEVAIAVLTVVVLRFIFVYFFALYQKNQRPGQVRCWPIVGSTMTLNANMNGLHDFLAELHEKNEVVWITYPFGLEGLYITDPASTEHMLKINFPELSQGRLEVWTRGSARPMEEDTQEKTEEEEFSTGPLSVLMMSAKNNTQVLINCRNNKLLG
ncbi:hypothetical protein R1flu_006115 [Riccia fluitans]|uniref:Small nuclear ribonucleoprotein Sm D2 n=1 Tax=Riccia fluitans TaxID=41844 RepID=A0ABD1YV42_9MARC